MNKAYILNAPQSLKYITDNMHDILNDKIEQYKKIFKIKQLNPIQINYFDNLEEFRNFIYKIRGEKESLPEYATGTYDNGMINAFITPNIDINSNDYKIKLYLANHELFHILYMQYILKNDYQKRIVWYDEGMAQFLSGEMDELLDIEKFKKFYLKVKNNTLVIPNLNEIEHGTSFCNNNYNGYDLSYLCIRYLREIMTNEEFQDLMSNFSKIKEFMLKNPDAGFITFDQYRITNSEKEFSLGNINSPLDCSHRLFDILRECDSMKLTKIYSMRPPADGVGFALCNRLFKAAGGKIITLD